MYESTTVAENIKNKAKEKGIQLKDMLLELGLNKNTLSNMYKGSSLKSDSLARIADYLGCSVDYLLGREGVAAESAATTAETAAGAQQDPRRRALLRDDKTLDRLLDCYSDLTAEGQGKVADYAADLHSNDKYKKLFASRGERLVG